MPCIEGASCEINEKKEDRRNVCAALIEFFIPSLGRAVASSQWHSREAFEARYLFHSTKAVLRAWHAS